MLWSIGLKCSLFSVFKTVIGCIALAGLVGCDTVLLGTYGEQNQTLSEFAQHVEAIFKFQNRMTNAVMLIEPEPSNEIQEAEQAMKLACEPLNEYASREMDGLSLDFSLQRRVEKSAIRCERAAQRLQAKFSLVK